MFLGIGVITALIVLAPQSSHAGILASLVRIFAGTPSEIEESFPVFIPSSQAAAIVGLDADNRPPDDGGGQDFDRLSPINVVRDNALSAPLNPLGVLAADNPSSGQIFVYTLRPGDTLGSIAKSFGVSVNTIIWANSVSNPKTLKTGDQLIILPVSGVRHTVKKDDTVAGIAKKYRADIDDILQYNGLAAGDILSQDSVIIIPNCELFDASPIVVSQARNGYSSNLPAYNGFYFRPIVGGRKSRGIHGYNGVDLASSCGLPVFASADGQVLIARSSGWNGGYGRYLAVSHSNNTQTLYAHLKEIMVSPGQTVRQGAVIGLIGSSGNSTGCHVHFEIRGARNPF